MADAPPQVDCRPGQAVLSCGHMMHQDCFQRFRKVIPLRGQGLGFRGCAHPKDRPRSDKPPPFSLPPLTPRSCSCLPWHAGPRVVRVPVPHLPSAVKRAAPCRGLRGLRRVPPAAPDSLEAAQQRRRGLDLLLPLLLLCGRDLLAAAVRRVPGKDQPRGPPDQGPGAGAPRARQLRRGPRSRSERHVEGACWEPQRGRPGSPLEAAPRPQVSSPCPTKP